MEPARFAVSSRATIGGANDGFLAARDVPVLDEEAADQHGAVAHEDADHEQRIDRHGDEGLGAGGEQPLGLAEDGDGIEGGRRRDHASAAVDDRAVGADDDDVQLDAGQPGPGRVLDQRTHALLDLGGDRPVGRAHADGLVHLERK